MNFGQFRIYVKRNSALYQILKGSRVYSSPSQVVSSANCFATITRRKQENFEMRLIRNIPGKKAPRGNSVRLLMRISHCKPPVRVGRLLEIEQLLISAASSWRRCMPPAACRRRCQRASPGERLIGLELGVHHQSLASFTWPSYVSPACWG